MGLSGRESADEPLPIRYRYLAVEAFERGELSEGQLARFLRTDRVGARRMVSLLGHQSAVTEEGEPALQSFNLASPI